jgi:hypothetical protein
MDYVCCLDFAKQNRSNFSDPNLLYDYNEVQELFWDETINNFVYLVGKTGLNKTAMLKQMVINLFDKGIDKRNILYLDYNIPFVRTLPMSKFLLDLFSKRNYNQNFYLIINEITLNAHWETEIERVRSKYDFVKVLASCSISPEIHEYFFDFPNDYSKIVVLSPKNESNIKSKQIAFGIFNEFKYNIKNGICEIKGLTKEGKAMEKHIIPREINGYPVKIIASGAFHHRSEMKEIVIPASIEYIGDYAFTHCTNLTRIELPTNLKYIGDCAFLGTLRLGTLNGGERVTYIGNSAFYGTEWLKNNSNEFITLGTVLYQYKGTDKNIIIPNGIETIGYYAFANNKSVETIDLRYIEKVSEGAFINCINLEYIINYQLNSVSAFQFFNCRKLQCFDCKLQQVGRFAFFNNYTLKSINVNNAIIENDAFEGNNLEKISGSVQTIGDFAFFQSNVRTINLKRTKQIGKFAFFNAKINNLSLETAAKIENYAFASNLKLKTVSVHESAVIGEGVFCGSNNIETATLSGKYPLDYYFKEKSKIKHLTINGECVDNLNRNNPFLLSLTVNSDRIGNWAFYHNDNLSRIELHIREFGAWCFAYCDGIERIDIPAEVNYIEMNAFRYCHNLGTIILRNKKVVLFGANAFYSTNNGKTILVKDKSAYLKIDLWQEYKNNLRNIEEYGEKNTKNTQFLKQEKKEELKGFA